jgi:hypothetical protein
MECRNTGGRSDALTATVTTALRQQSRRSAHPSDQAALRQTAACIANALEAVFLLVPRHEVSARLPGRSQMNVTEHE